ncbi:MAG TPA: hypothetical protein VFA18_00965, partial [Gemmataceae bacterium]|nr:hypothetical protein [Gemmataceae bacterium]
MSEGSSATGSRPRLSLWVRLLGVLLLVTPCAVGGVYIWHKLHPHVPPATVAATDPRLVADTPYRNVRPEVGYVGDAVCAGCHSKIADTYRHHPMARSLTPVSKALKKTPGDKIVSGVLDELPIEWSVETHDGRMIQRLRGKDPKSTLRHEDEIRYLLGSGSRGQSALIDR